MKTESILKTKNITYCTNNINKGENFMKKILKTMSFLVCSLAVLGSPVLGETPTKTYRITKSDIKETTDGKECICLSGEHITSLKNGYLFKGNLSKVTSLILSSNELTQESLKVLLDMPNLEELNLNYNKIESLKGFPQLNKLRKLNLSGNKLTLTDLDDLPDLPLTCKNYMLTLIKI